MAEITDIVSIWDGVPRGDVLYLIAGSDQLTEERAPHTMLIEFHEGPRAVATLEWTARDIAADPDSPGVLVMGLQGQVARFHSGQVDSLPPITGPPPASPRGTLLYLGYAGPQLMACGGNQQVYRYASGGGWTRQEEGVTPPPDGGLTQFEFVVGDADGGQLYTGGARGEAWRWIGQRWQSLDMPTNVRLVSARRAPDGRWWIAGQVGTILRGSGTAWEEVHHDEAIPYFWDLAFFHDDLFLTAGKLLYRWHDGQLDPVNFGDDTLYEEGPIPYSFYKFGVTDERLYTFGAKDIMSFDGAQWVRIV
jgi:hypothetical protein